MSQRGEHLTSCQAGRHSIRQGGRPAEDGRVFPGQLEETASEFEGRGQGDRVLRRHAGDRLAGSLENQLKALPFGTTYSLSPAYSVL
jgi:hypothetical protein